MYVYFQAGEKKLENKNESELKVKDTFAKTFHALDLVCAMVT